MELFPKYEQFFIGSELEFADLAKVDQNALFASYNEARKLLGGFCRLELEIGILLKRLSCDPGRKPFYDDLIEIEVPEHLNQEVLFVIDRAHFGRDISVTMDEESFASIHAFSLKFVNYWAMVQWAISDLDSDKPEFDTDMTILEECASKAHGEFIHENDLLNRLHDEWKVTSDFIEKSTDFGNLKTELNSPEQLSGTDGQSRLCWNETESKLRLDGKVIRNVAEQAVNIQKLLRHCEQAKWHQPILLPKDVFEDAEKLRRAVISLNSTSLIRFKLSGREFGWGDLPEELPGTSEELA